MAGELNGQRGWFPANYVKEIQPASSAAASGTFGQQGSDSTYGTLGPALAKPNTVGDTLADPFNSNFHFDFPCFDGFSTRPFDVELFAGSSSSMGDATAGAFIPTPNPFECDTVKGPTLANGLHAAEGIDKLPGNLTRLVDDGTHGNVAQFYDVQSNGSANSSDTDCASELLMPNTTAVSTRGMSCTTNGSCDGPRGEQATLLFDLMGNLGSTAKHTTQVAGQQPGNYAYDQPQSWPNQQQVGGAVGWPESETPPYVDCNVDLPDTVSRLSCFCLVFDNRLGER